MASADELPTPTGDEADDVLQDEPIVDAPEPAAPDVRVQVKPRAKPRAKAASKNPPVEDPPPPVEQAPPPARKPRTRTKAPAASRAPSHTQIPEVQNAPLGSASTASHPFALLAQALHNTRVNREQQRQAIYKSFVAGY